MTNEAKLCQWHNLDPGAQKCTRMASKEQYNEETLQKTAICEFHYAELEKMEEEDLDKWLTITGTMTPSQKAANEVRDQVRKYIEELRDYSSELDICIALLGEAQLSQARLSEEDEKKAHQEAGRIYGEEAGSLRRSRNRSIST
jgi:hypothetical protein